MLAFDQPIFLSYSLSYCRLDWSQKCDKFATFAMAFTYPLLTVLKKCNALYTIIIMWLLLLLTVCTTDLCRIPMTHAPETGTINPLHFLVPVFDANFSYHICLE